MNVILKLGYALKLVNFEDFYNIFIVYKTILPLQKECIKSANISEKTFIIFFFLIISIKSCHCLGRFEM